MGAMGKIYRTVAKCGGQYIGYVHDIMVQNAKDTFQNANITCRLG